MTSRQVRSLDQRIADTRRELEALEAKKRVRDDKTLSWLTRVVRRLEKGVAGDQDANHLLDAASHLNRYLVEKTLAEEASP